MTVSVMRAIGPAAANSLFSVSIEKGLLGGWLVYYVLLATTFATLFVGSFLPKVPLRCGFYDSSPSTNLFALNNNNNNNKIIFLKQTPYIFYRHVSYSKVHTHTHTHTFPTPVPVNWVLCQHNITHPERSEHGIKKKKSPFIRFLSLSL